MRERSPSSSRDFDLDAASIAAVRSFVQEMARRSGADQDAAALLASELATNAVLHARSAYQVRTLEAGNVFRVEVVNDAPEMVAAMREPSGESGRGLQIVDVIARQWGSEVRGAEKVVWFELETP